MKNKLLKFVFAGILAISLPVCGLTACTVRGDVDTETEIRISVLSGTTGYGMVKLMNDSEAKTTTLNYSITVETQITNIQGALVNGSVDIAALPTNKAANIANQTNGKIQMLAVNTLGVMYLATTNGEIVSSFEDLRGKTVGVPLEPSYILTSLCEANGLTVGTDVVVETYATPAELQKNVIAGKTEYAVLPEPLLSTAISKKENIKASLNLTTEWKKAHTDGELMQGCLVVRTAWADAHTAELRKFLTEYKASVDYVNENPADAGKMVEKYIGTAAAVAENAIPRCNLTYIAGAEMKTKMTAFYTVLQNVNGANIGAVPTDSFYYGA